jgi:hypothetical protein
LCIAGCTGQKQEKILEILLILSKNEAFKSLVTRKKHVDSADTNLNFVALFVLWHNARAFKEGNRRGHSPGDILGIDLVESD